MPYSLRYTLPAALILAGSSLMAQGDTPASLMLELERELPRKHAQNMATVSLSHSIDWDAAGEKLGALVARAKDTYVEPHAIFMHANTLFAAGRIEESRAMFVSMKDQYGKHPLCALRPDKDSKSLVDQAIDECVVEEAFRKAHAIQTLPSPEFEDSTTATLHLSAGDVKLRFYKNVAPKHRDNFLKLASEGFYDRTRVHRVQPGILVALGDPTSREPNPAIWGRGDPGYTLPAEHSLVTHTRGTVTMWRAPGPNISNGCQFQILLKEHAHLDFVQTPFAEVLDGLRVLEQVSRQSRNQYEAPVEHVYLNGITIEKQ